MTEEQSFLPDETTPTAVEGDYLPAPDIGPILRVPRNTEEVAAQMTAAADTLGTFPLEYGKALSALRAEGSGPMLSQIYTKELEDRQAAAKQHALAAAQNRDVEGTAFAAKVASALEAGKAAVASASPVDTQKTAAARALESTGGDFARRVYDNLADYADKVDAVAGDVAVRNILAQEGASLNPSYWDIAKHLFFSLIPGATTVSTSRAISKIVGESFWLDQQGAINSFRNYMLGLDPKERTEVVRKLLEQESNPAAKADLLRKLAELTKEEAVTDDALQVVQAVDIGYLVGALASLMRKGTPLKAVKEASGEKAAGELAADELINKSGISGLNEPEIISRLLAAGKLPLEVDPAATAGLSAAGHARLREGWNTMLADVQARLNAAGRTADEKQAGAAAVRASYMPENNPRIYSVEYGEASDDGLSMVVHWQQADGTMFLSKEAAEAFIKDRGLVGARVVAKDGDAVMASTGDDFTILLSLRNSLGRELEAYSAALKAGDKTAAVAAKARADARTKELAKVLKVSDEDAATLASVREVDFIRALTRESRSPLDSQTGIDGLKTAGPDEVRSTFAAFYGADMIEPEMGPILSRFEALLQAGKSPTVSTQRVLEHLVRNAVDEDVRFLANALLEQSGRTGLGKVPIRLGPSHAAEEGVYVPLADSIRISSNHASTPSLYVHEITHAHNGQVIALVRSKPAQAAKVLTADQVEAAQSVIELHKRLKAWHDKKTLAEKAKHGSLYDDLRSDHLRRLETPLSQAEELLAYGTSSEKVRQVLKNIKLSELGYTSNDSVFSFLWGEFKRILGFKADDTVLAKLTESFDKLLGSVDEPARKVLNRLHDAGALSRESVNAMVRGDMKSVAKGKGPLSMRKALEKELTKTIRTLTKDLSEEQRVAALKRVDELKAAIAGMDAPAAAGTGSPPTGWLVRQERTDPYSYANVGKFDREDIDAMSFIALDPKHGASESSMSARVVGVHAEAKTRKALSDFIAPFYKGLSDSSKQRVRALLEEGDSFSNGGSTGREFTFMEATAKGLSDREAEAYLATRSLRMAMYHIRNGEMTRHLRAQGFMQIEFASGYKTVGKDLSRDGANAWVDRTIWDASAGKWAKLSSKEMTEAYAGGKRIVHLAEPTKMDGELRQFMLVDNSVAKTKEIVNALAYRPGEYARIYTDEYFITMTRRVKVDGEMKELTSTVRTAASVREAQDFVDKVSRAIYVLKNNDPALATEAAISRELEMLLGNYFNVDDFRALYKEGQLEDVVSLSHHFTRNKDEYLNGSVGEALANGRLFTSKRSERLFSTDAERPNSLGVFESLEAEITSVSRVANINEWREVQIRRWMNTFGDMLPRRTGDDVADFYSAAGATFTKGSEDALFAERTHKYIMRQVGLRTSEEQAYANITRRMTEKWFAGNEAIEGVGAKIRQMGVLDFVRHANFTLTLGMFNPAQLIVQANGAAQAIILSPVHGLAASKTFPLLRMALMSDNPAVHRFFANADVLTNLGLRSADEFVELVGAIRQTGIIDNLRSTALWNSESGRLNIFNGMPSRVLGQHTFFFNRGEEFARVVSFDVARREWMAANPGQAWNTPDVLRALVVRQDNLTQNMTKSNLAFYQKGALSVPLQFAQYNIKLFSNVMAGLVGKGKGRGFTRAESVQLLIGHVLLYGAAGNGLVALADEVLPQEMKDTMSVEAKTLLAQGLLGSIVSYFGEAISGERTNVAISTRLGSFNYYYELQKAAFSDPKNVYAALLGPTLGTAKRLGTIGEVAYLWHKDPDVTAVDVLDGLSKIGVEQIGTLRNAAKAYLYHQHANKIIDSKGMAVAQLTTPEVLFQALGFQSTAAIDVHRLIASKREHTEAIQDIAALVYKVQKDIMTARYAGNDKRAEELHKTLNALWPENTGDFMEVQRIVRNKLFPYDTSFQKLQADYMMKGHTYTQPLVTTQPPRK